MNRIQKLSFLYAVTMANICNNPYSHRKRLESPKEKTIEQGKIEQEQRKIRQEQRKIEQGQIKFTFPDGFECFALNQKNADRKHNNWLKSKI